MWSYSILIKSCISCKGRVEGEWLISVANDYAPCDRIEKLKLLNVVGEKVECAKVLLVYVGEF